MNNVKKALKKLGAKAKDLFMSLKKKKEQLTVKIAMSLIAAVELAVPAFAEGGGGDAVDPDAAFNNVVGFFATWIGRIGLVVGFVGAIMFALAIKNDDADAKTRGLMTLVSGFVVFAVTKALDMFGLTGGSL
ncbi:MAG: hypothetical protein NC452_18755 [Eubacterium sp.]|nr:hypothetical protein [Eubacterium sp.]